VPDGVAYVEPFRRRVRGVRAGGDAVDSERALLVHRPGRPPIWAFPEADVRGVAARPVPEAPGHVEVPWDGVDAWYQEDDRVLLHAPNPYHRVECVRTSRRLRVEAAGVALVDAAGFLAVYEAALEPRAYVARERVRMELLVPSATRTHCPYKGEASYWNAVVGDVVVEDAAWSYEDPLPEAVGVRGLLSFDDARVTVVHGIPPAG
jgi:uncharacterized protein (DUF427 family)